MSSTERPMSSTSTPEGIGSSSRLALAPNGFVDHTVDHLLPTGTVTLLLADVEGSTRMWENRPEEMAAALATLDLVLAELVHANHGVCPIEQGEGDSFVVAFARASDAVACALALQRAALSPLRLRIGVHTGEIRLRDEGKYMGPTINRTARLRDLAHGGQTVLSGTASDLVCDSLPAQAWLADCGSHLLRDLPRPERVAQLCHPDTHNDFPPLRTRPINDFHWRPVQLTTFVGRISELAEVGRLLEDNRLLTLTGAGGVGKTRLAVEAACRRSERYGGAIAYVDLAPITDPELVSVAAALALGLPELPRRGFPGDTVAKHIGDRQLLLVVDNCEHLLDASAELIGDVLRFCPNATVLATSREPIAVNGEQTWRVPSLSLHDDAIALFTERARRACSEFTLGAREVFAVLKICRRLDGMPLAIELAASRVRALSLNEIADGLHDRFHLLTGGSRTVARRQQTLKACVDWSYDLLTEPEKAALRAFSVLPGAFDAAAAQTAAGACPVDGLQVVDLLASLVDKSLLTTETRCGRTRYRFSETMRQYASDRLCDGGIPPALAEALSDSFKTGTHAFP
jgi:predicted ATPase/class 3 adenylate cyclase